MKVISEFDFKEISITIEGDYYQILFHNGLDTEDEPYFMIQAQFELPSGGECYFESHQEKLIGHNRPISTSLAKNVLRVSYGQHPINNVEVWFSATEDDYKRLAATLTEMIPEIHVETVNYK